MAQRKGNPPEHARREEHSTSGVAKEQASNVGEQAMESGAQVADVAADQAKDVVSEAGRQASELIGHGKDQLRDKARESQEKATNGLYAIADHLRRMSDESEEPGIATDIVREAAQRTHGLAGWLESRQPGDLLEEIRGFARRRPGLFLAGAAVAGVVAGRLTRGVAAAAHRGSEDARAGSAEGTPRHAAPTEPTPVAYPPTAAPQGPVGPAHSTPTVPPQQPPLPQPSGYPQPPFPQPTGYAQPPLPQPTGYAQSPLPQPSGYPQPADPAAGYGGAPGTSGS